jgi:hypothetical protein
MSASATSSDAHRDPVRRPVALVVALSLVITAGLASSTVLVTVEEALAVVFPDSDTARETLFLTEDQLDRAEVLAGQRPEGALVTRYVARRDGRIVGWAYLDTHRVRTLPETLMVVVAPDATVVRVEVVAFREPLEYIPPEGWYEQFGGRGLDEELELKRAIRPVTGATLTARATSDAVRRILAIHDVVEQPPSGGGE